MLAGSGKRKDGHYRICRFLALLGKKMGRGSRKNNLKTQESENRIDTDRGIPLWKRGVSVAGPLDVFFMPCERQFVGKSSGGEQGNYLRPPCI